MFKRFYEDLNPYLKANNVLIIYGPRRVGKTVLLERFLNNSTLKYKLDNGDDMALQEVLGSGSIERIKSYAQGYELIAIDEAQNIPNVGQALKILVDHVPKVKVIATGSASFDLTSKVGEPLTGRHTALRLYPLAQLELLNTFTRYELEQKKEDYLIFGSYPDVLNLSATEEKIGYLRELANSYLLKDILALEHVKNSKTLLDLLRLLAFQVGSEVSLSELASNLGIDSKTVARYLDLLEKGFVLINIRGFSKNLRKEVTSKSKYYFYDLGIRNAIISNFNSLNLRDDIGKLWENFLVIERMKKQEYKKIIANNYFWRTWDGAEVDFLEEREGNILGYEFKYGKKRVKNKQFIKTYPKAKLEIINQENYLDFVI